MSTETYNPYPEHGWTCFHCGETFHSVGAARDHFGADPSATPGCMVRVQYGEERGLLIALREAQAEIERLRTDIENETTATRFFSLTLQLHLKSYRPFRECQTLQDVFNVYDSMEGRALAAEERLALDTREQLAALIKSLHDGIESMYNGSYANAGDALESARQLGYRLLGDTPPVASSSGDRLTFQPITRTALAVYLRKHLQTRFTQWKDAADHYGINHSHMSNIVNDHTRPTPWMLADVGAYYGYVQDRERELTANQVRALLRDYVQQRFRKITVAAIHYGVNESTMSAKLRDGARHGPNKRMLDDIGVEHGFFLRRVTR